APVGVLLRVLILMTYAARTFGAGHGSGVGVYAEFEALAVDVVAQRLHARGKPLHIGHDVARSVAPGLPAVVENDELIARVLHAVRCHRIGGSANNLLVEVLAPKLVP